jgi:HNH endonuclease
MSPAHRRKVPVALGRRVRQQARYRCGYCLCSEALLGMPMEFDHLIPQADRGITREENLWLSCRRCNAFKGRQTHAHDPHSTEWVALFNPRQQVWIDHFTWGEDGTEILGKTPCGRATVATLRMNNAEIVVARRLWVSVGWWPPND